MTIIKNKFFLNLFIMFISFLFCCEEKKKRNESKMQNEPLSTAKRVSLYAEQRKTSLPNSGTKLKLSSQTHSMSFRTCIEIAKLCRSDNARSLLFR